MSVNPNIRLMALPHPGPQQQTQTQALEPARLRSAKRAFSTRRVDFSRAVNLISSDYQPQVGDLLLARVGRVGHHKRIERPDGRRAHLFAGDEIIVCYGNRYAPDQFEGLVPDHLGECELVAAGGIAASVVCKHRSVAAATRLEPLGILADEQGRALNLSQFALAQPSTAGRDLPPVLAVVGTSMNAGKTTAAARLIRGLSRAGKRVASAKITGTGAGGDFWTMLDAGAQPVIDFTDAGLPSTHGVGLAELESVMSALLMHLHQSAPDAIVIEVADGLLQSETRRLIEGAVFNSLVDQVVFAAGDAMGAVAGYRQLQQTGCRIAALSGAFTAAPLAVREVQRELDCPVYQKTELSDPEVACSLIGEPIAKADRVDETAASV